MNKDDTNKIFGIGVKFREPITEIYLKEIQFRVTSFMRAYLIAIAEMFRKQVAGRYSTIKDENSKKIIDNLHSYFIDVKKVPQKNLAKVKTLTREEEEHHAAVLVSAIRMPATEVDINSTIIKVVANKNKLKQSPPEVFLLIRYGPWHMNYLPFIPKEGDATILFVNVGRDQLKRAQEKNKRERNLMMQLLRKFSVKFTPRKEIYQNLHGYDSLEYWAIKKEFGIDVKKVPVWKPSLQYIVDEGYAMILLKDLDVSRTLFDPLFKNYKNVDKKYKIEKEEYVNNLISFQDRLRG
jgi:hypothetical protein